jgi:hypothetical protein
MQRSILSEIYKRSKASSETSERRHEFD